MKTYLLNESLIERLIEIGRESAYGGYDVRTISPRSLFLSVLEQLDTYPIEIDDVTVKNINFPCRFFPATQIVGFTIDESKMTGVFIK